MRFLRALWAVFSRLWTQTPTPSPKLQTPAASATPLGWTEADPAQPLISTLAIEARRAANAGKIPVVFLHAAWCPPSMEVKKTRSEPLMREAFAPVHVIEVDIDRMEERQLEAAGMKCSVIPKFYRLDGRGKTTGAEIDGGAWGANIPENMAPPLARFFGSAANTN